MEKIFNIGAKDFNSYLVCGEKNIIIDTVPNEYSEEFFKNIEEHISVLKIDYLVFTRTSPDASGAVLDLLLKNPKIEVFATVAGLKNLKEIINGSFLENVIKNEAELDFGEDKLQFLITPNLSWPDTAVCFLKNEKKLFSGNLFCKSPERDAFGKEFLENALKRIKGLDIKEIYPGYGKALGFSMYDEILAFEPEEKTAVIYASTSGQTEKLAQAICYELSNDGKKAILLNAEKLSKEEILEQADNCTSFAFGTPTINHNAHTAVLDIIVRMNVLKNSGKKAFVFGSYGWSGEGVNIVSTLLGNLKLRLVTKPYRCIFNPSDDNISDLKKYLKEIENA